jgi:hypothetical protein
LRRVEVVPAVRVAPFTWRLLCSDVTPLCAQEEAAGNIDSELAIVLSSVALACKQISSLVARSGISGMTGLAGAANIQVRPSTLLCSDLCRMQARIELTDLSGP